MSYTITGKNGITPRSLEGLKTFDDVMHNVNLFIAFNTPRKALGDNAAKIAYYNKKSFYSISEVK